MTTAPDPASHPAPDLTPGVTLDPTLDLTPERVASMADDAYERIAPFVRVTPLEPLQLSASGSVDLLIKAEHLQHTGSFKVRGALAALSALSPERRHAGVITASSGNHGLGVAYALSVLGGSGTVFVPRQASSVKVAAIERFGVTVRRLGHDSLAAELAAREEADRLDLAYLSPYNDAHVIAGQGTVGLDIADQLDSKRLGAVVVAVGGGGLISGVAAVLRRRFPDVRVIAASPSADAAMAVAVQAGVVVSAQAEPTLSDGTAGALEPGAVTLPLCEALVDDWVLIGEEEIAATMRDVLESHHQLVEGAAAVAIAAARRVDPATLTVRDGAVVVVSCGANVSLDVLRRVLN